MSSIIEILKVFLAGFVVGMGLKFVGLPSLAPGSLAAILGILGLFLGYAIVSHIR